MSQKPGSQYLFPVPSSDMLPELEVVAPRAQRFRPKRGEPGFSLEYFPPKGIAAERSLLTCSHALRQFAPKFQTMTFGAGGTAPDATAEWADSLARLTGVPTAAHITLCAFDREPFLAEIDRLVELGITRFVVLRGDPKEGVETSDPEGLAGFGSVAGAVEAIKERYGNADVSIAAYPEIHPKAGSQADDLQVLAAKFLAGADRAITQFFFNNDDFYRLRDRLERIAPDADLVPGIMPITNFTNICRFSGACGAKIPQSFYRKFEMAGDDKAAQTDAARSVLQAQISDLVENGVNFIHIYTMNRIDLTADAIRAFQAASGTGAAPEQNIRQIA